MKGKMGANFEQLRCLSTVKTSIKSCLNYSFSFDVPKFYFCIFNELEADRVMKRIIKLMIKTNNFVIRVVSSSTL